jgi:hypothetical protein
MSAIDEAIERLLRRYEGMKSVVIKDTDGTGILGMPTGWAIVNILREDGTLKLQAGVSPEGRIAT